jgi:hypothetical protein
MTGEKLREKTPLHSTELSHNRIPMGTVLAGFLPIFCRFFADFCRNLQVYPPLLATQSAATVVTQNCGHPLESRP